MRVAATTALGLEPVLRDEARRHGARPTDDDLDLSGWQTLDVDGLADVAELIGSLRTAYRVGPVLAETRFDRDGPWPDLEAVVDGLDLARWLDADATFAVRCARSGDQDFDSPDVERRVGGFVDERTDATVDLDDPDTLIRVQVDPDCRATVWLDPVGYDALHKRRYRAVDHRAALTAPLACTLLELAGWTPDEQLVDPMCGGGTVPIEAAWAAHGTPVTALRDDLLWDRIPAVRDAGLAGAVPTGAPAGDCDHARIVAGDANADSLGGAKGNARRAGVEDCLDLRQADARKLGDRLDAADVVATNPPYGVRSGSWEGVERLYRSFLTEAADVLADGGRVVLVTPRDETLRDAADEAGLVVGDEMAVRHGRLEVGLFVLRAR